MLRKLHLYGSLGEKYGKEHRLDVKSVGEAMRAMQANYPGFRQEIKKDVNYYVACGEELNNETALSNDTVFLEFLKGDFHLAPVVEGSKSSWGNIGLMTLGVVLMVASYWVPAGGALGYGLITSSLVFNVGLALFATGIMGIISPAPQVGDYGAREAPEERPSFVFDGPVNTVAQGGPVVLIYGHMIVGSTLVSSSLEVKDV
jgi:predicted phage tail protein